MKFLIMNFFVSHLVWFLSEMAKVVFIKRKYMEAIKLVAFYIIFRCIRVLYCMFGYTRKTTQADNSHAYLGHSMVSLSESKTLELTKSRFFIIDCCSKGLFVL